MKLTQSLFLTALLFIPCSLFLSAADVMAQRSGSSFITAESVNGEIVPRLQHNAADVAITTREGSVDLLIAGESILIQFTDRFLEGIEKEIKSETKEHDTHLANVIRSMVSSGVTTLLDRAISIPFSEISEVYYEEGRLYILNHEGREIFDNLDIDGKQVMEDFRRRDARRFAEQAESRMI